MGDSRAMGEDAFDVTPHVEEVRNATLPQPVECGAATKDRCWIGTAEPGVRLHWIVEHLLEHAENGEQMRETLEDIGCNTPDLPLTPTIERGPSRLAEQPTLVVRGEIPRRGEIDERAKRGWREPRDVLAPKRCLGLCRRVATLQLRADSSMPAPSGTSYGQVSLLRELYNNSLFRD